MSNNVKKRNHSVVLKNILENKSNNATTLQSLYNSDAELVNRLNFFNTNCEITEESNGKKINNSLYNLKLPYQQTHRRQESPESLKLPYISLRKSVNKSIDKQDVLDSGRGENLLERNSYLRRLENLANENKLENKKKNLMEKIKNLKNERKMYTKQILSLQQEIEEMNIQVEFLENFEKYGANIIGNANLKNYEMVKSLRRRSKEEENLYFVAISKVKRDTHKREQTLISIKEEIEKFKETKKNFANKNSEINKKIIEIKQELFDTKHKLLLHYHVLLKEGTDTRHEGLVWLIKAIWNLDENVIISNCPDFLDEKAIEYLFITAKKEVELQDIKNQIEDSKLKMGSYLKNPSQMRFSVFKTNIKSKENFFKKIKKMHKNKNFLELYEKQSTRNLININLKKMEEVFSSKIILSDEIKQILQRLKEMEKNYEEEKAQLAIKRKAELNRIGREFLLNDYKRRFNADLRTVISAIAGEDNINYELLKLERDKKEFMDKIKICRNFDVLDSNIYKTE